MLILNPFCTNFLCFKGAGCPCNNQPVQAIYCVRKWLEITVIIDMLSIIINMIILIMFKCCILNYHSLSCCVLCVQISKFHCKCFLSAIYCSGHGEGSFKSSLVCFSLQTQIGTFLVIGQFLSVLESVNFIESKVPFFLVRSYTLTIEAHHLFIMSFMCQGVWTWFFQHLMP